MIKKLSMILFMTGALIAILGGSFTFARDMHTLAILLPIILGVFIGIINISRDEEIGFLIAGGVFIIGSQAIISLLEEFILFDFIGKILENFMILIAPACIIVGFRLMVEFASQSEWSFKKEEKLLEHIYVRLSRKDMLWDDVILFSVSITFIILILQLFFDIRQYLLMINIIDWIIIGVFAIDLIVIYKRVGNFRKFVKVGWLDIIAVIPIGMFMRIAKVVRFARILQTASRVNKTSKIGAIGRISRINRPAKFLSESSARYEKEKRIRRKKV